MRHLTGESGAVALARSYKPFGGLLESEGSGTSVFGFTGEQTDETGLLFLRARYYDPQVGRFLSRDPFPGLMTRPGTLNPYVYVLNNPLKYTDPSGHCEICEGIRNWLQVQQGKFQAWWFQYDPCGMSADPSCGIGVWYPSSVTEQGRKIFARQGTPIDPDVIRMVEIGGQLVPFLPFRHQGETREDIWWDWQQAEIDDILANELSDIAGDFERTGGCPRYDYGLRGADALTSPTGEIIFGPEAFEAESGRLNVVMTILEEYFHRVLRFDPNYSSWSHTKRHKEIEKRIIRYVQTKDWGQSLTEKQIRDLYRAGRRFD